MRERFMKKAQAFTTGVMPGVNPLCTDPECNHAHCVKDSETGEWYKAEKIPYPLAEDELPCALLMEQIKHLQTIKNVLLFFAALVGLSLLITIVQLAR